MMAKLPIPKVSQKCAKPPIIAIGIIRVSASCLWFLFHALNNIKQKIPPPTSNPACIKVNMDITTIKQKEGYLRSTKGALQMAIIPAANIMYLYAMRYHYFNHSINILR